MGARHMENYKGQKIVVSCPAPKGTPIKDLTVTLARALAKRKSGVDLPYLGAVPNMTINQLADLFMKDALDILKPKTIEERLDAVPLVASIRRNAEEIRRQELAKTWRNLVDNWPLDSSDAGRDQLAEQLDAMTSAIVKKLLHHPTLYLKELKDPAQQEFVHHIFNLDSLTRSNSTRTPTSNRRPSNSD